MFPRENLSEFLLEKELPIEAKIDGESCYLAFVEQHSGEALKITDKCGKYRVYPKN